MDKEKRNMEALAEKTEDVWDNLQKGHIETNRAKELFNGAGKIINTFKVRLEYHKLRKEKPEIKYLRC